MIAVFRYFWFAFAAMALVNVLVWRHRLRPLVDEGSLTQAEMDGFIRGVAGWVSGTCVLLGCIGLAAGWSDPFCGGRHPFDGNATAATSLVMLTAWGALLWWVWMGNGADLLGRIGPALARSPLYSRRFPPHIMRWVVTAFVLLVAASSFVAHHQSPGCIVPEYRKAMSQGEDR